MDERPVHDQLAISRVLAEYCQLCDDGDFIALVERFTPDGEFVFGRRSATGRPALVEWFERTQTPELRGKHLTTNSLIDVAADGDHAAVSSDFLFTQISDNAITLALAGRYRDAFVRVDGRWLIERREAVPMCSPRATSE